MRVIVVGAGAVGGLLGALLVRAGHDVAFVARGESLAVLRSRGIVVRKPPGSAGIEEETIVTGPVRAAAVPSELGACDLVLVAVKSGQVEAIAPSLAPVLAPAAMVVPLQNGVEAAEQLASALGDEAVLGGLCHVLATREAAGDIRYVGLAPALTLGERAGGASDRVEQLAGRLREAGVTVAVSVNIQVALWSKLLFVEPLGSVGAATRASVEIVRAIPETRALLEQAMREVQAVAIARGVPVPDDTIAASLARIDAMPAGATASMHRDLVEGRPSELNEQTGAVVRLGERASTPRPVHDVLFAALLPQERRARGL